MAFVGGTSQQDDPNKQGQPGQGQNPLAQQAPVSTSSAPGAGPGAAPSTSATGAVASNQSTPQPFTNLQAYLTANAPQISGMGDKIAGQINQGYGQVQNDINAGTQGFQSQVSSGYAAPNADVVKQATTNPTQFASDPNNVKAFQAQLNNQYTGPQSFEGSDYYANLNKEVQDSATKANQVNTPSGMQSYLTGIENNPTAGDTTLDQVLLYGNPGALSTIKGAASQAAGLPDYLSSLIPGQNQSVQDATNAANSSRQAAQEGLTGAGKSFSDQLAQELSQAQGDYSTYNQDVGQVRGAAQDINQQILAYLAANPNLNVSGGNDYLSPWLNLQESTNAPNQQNVATGQDYSTQAALSQLAGDSGLFNSPINQSTTGQAGTFALPMDLQAAIANKDVPAAMQKELGSLSGQITGAFAPYQQAQDAYSQAQESFNQIRDTQLPALQQQLGSTPKTIVDTTTGNDVANPAYTQLMQQISDLTNQMNTAQQNADAQGRTMQSLASGLQWLQPASTGYNDLVSKLQADLTGLSGMNVPQAKPVSIPGATPEQRAGNAATTAVGVGGPIAAGVGAGLAANATEAGALAAAQAGSDLPLFGPGAGMAGTDAALQSLGPAALAAYGTSNIAQNTMANPVKAGLADLANTGLSLATLSLPPKVLDSIGKGLQNVLNSIDNFFKGLF